MKKILNEAFRRLGKLFSNALSEEDKVLIAKVVSKTIASMVIFTIILLSSAGMTLFADSLESAVPGMRVEAMLIRIASFILLSIDLLWLIDVASRPFRRAKDRDR